jgi:hypothetical protein
MLLEESKKGLKILFICVLAILFTFFGILISNVFLKTKIENPQIVKSKPQVEKENLAKNSGSENLPITMLNSSGKITEISENELTFSSKINGQEYFFKALVTSRTKLFKKNVNKEKPVLGEPYNYFSSETETSFDNIKTGDDVVVEADEDMIKNPQFEAKAVSVVVNP